MKYIRIINFQSQIYDFTTFLGGWWVGGGWVGEIEIKDQLSPTEVEIRTEFGIYNLQW